MDRFATQIAAGGLLAMAAAMQWPGCKMLPKPASNAGPALCSFIMSAAHGTGLTLIPALMPLCSGEDSARRLLVSNPLLPVLATIGIHAAAMLAVTALLAFTAAVQRQAELNRLQG